MKKRIIQAIIIGILTGGGLLGSNNLNVKAAVTLNASDVKTTDSSISIYNAIKNQVYRLEDIAGNVVCDWQVPECEQIKFENLEYGTRYKLVYKNINDETDNGVLEVKTEKGRKSKPDENLIKVKDATAIGSADGEVYGVDETMEYHTYENDKWVRVTGNKITGLKADMVYIRYAETERTLPSAYTLVVVLDPSDPIYSQVHPDQVTPQTSQNPEEPQILAEKEQDKNSLDLVQQESQLQEEQSNVVKTNVEEDLKNADVVKTSDETNRGGIFTAALSVLSLIGLSLGKLNKSI